jgi:hypothetical protein
VTETSCSYTGCIGEADARRSFKRPATEVVFS